MTLRRPRMLPVCLAIALVFVVALAANAQVQRTFVSGTGVDTNPCSRTAPCRNFAAAIAATAADGEVVVLDSAGYGPVALTQSVALIAPEGVYAGITAFSGDAVTINAATTDTVVLHGLTMNGLGGASAITVAQVGTLNIENCMMSRFAQRGLNCGTVSTIHVNDTTARDNAGTGFAMTAGVGTPIKGSFDHCRSEHNGLNGFLITGGTDTVVTFYHCVSVNNSNDAGYFVNGSTVHVKSSVATNNGWGVVVQSGGIATVSASAVSSNAQNGLSNNGASQMITYGNNELFGNGAGATSGTITSGTLQ